MVWYFFVFYGMNSKQITVTNEKSLYTEIIIHFIYRSDLHTIINMYEYNTKNGNDIMCLEKLTLVVTAIKNVIY